MASTETEADAFILLCQAINAGRTDIINTLLKDYEIDSSRVDTKTGDTPMHMACRGSHVDCVRALLRKKFPVAMRNKRGDLAFNCGDSSCKQAFQTELLQRVVAGDKEGISELLSGGADPNTDGLPTSSSMIHWAITCNQFEVIKDLIEAGADVNLVSENGDAPLHEMCRVFSKATGATETIRDLLRAGANPDLVNKGGKTAKSLLDESESLKLEEIITELTHESGNDEDACSSVSSSSSNIKQIDDMEFSIPRLQQRVAQLEHRKEEQLEIITELRRNMNSLLTKDGSKEVIQSLEGQVEGLKLEVKSLQEENKSLRMAFAGELGTPEEVVQLLEFSEEETIDTLRVKWLDEAMKDERQKHERERASYEKYIRSLLVALPQDKRDEFARSRDWDTPRGEVSKYGAVNMVHHGGHDAEGSREPHTQGFKKERQVDDQSFFESFFSIFFGDPEDHYVDKELYRHHFRADSGQNGAKTNSHSDTQTSKSKTRSHVEGKASILTL